MKALILIWSLLLPYMALGQATSSDTQYRNDGETLINGSFEQGKKGYTLSVGSGSLVWSTQSTTSLNGKAMQLTLSAQTFSFKSATTQGSKLTGQNGYVEVYLSANNSGAEFCPLVDGVSAPTTTPNECQPIIAGVGFKAYGIQKIFGASSLNYEVRGTSGASYTGIIYLDDGSVAKSNRVNGVKFDTLYSANISLTGVKSNENKSGWLSAGPFTPTLTSVYTITFSSGIFTVAPNCAVSSNGAQNSVATLTSVPTASGVTVLTYQASINTKTAYDFTIVCEKTGIDLINSTAQVFNTTGGWFIDANIGGSQVAVPSIVSSYTEMTNSGLDLVINTSKGSAPAEIACASGTASVGLTCNTPAVAESVGHAFVPPKTGKYKACYAFTHYGVGSAEGTFQLIETPNNSVTVLQEGGERVSFYTNASQYSPFRVCGVFKFEDTNKKTIRLMTEVSANGTTSIVAMDRNASLGQRDLHITVEPIVENIQASLQGYVSIPSTVNPEIFSGSYAGANAGTPTATVCTTDPCTSIDLIGNGFHPTNGFRRTSLSSMTILTLKTYAKLKCTAQISNTVNATITAYNTSMSCLNCNTMSWAAGNAGSSLDTYGTVNCIGLPQ